MGKITVIHEVVEFILDRRDYILPKTKMIENWPIYGSKLVKKDANPIV